MYWYTVIIIKLIIFIIISPISPLKKFIISVYKKQKFQKEFKFNDVIILKTIIIINKHMQNKYNRKKM
jgi:hypothetical protein